jgi:hypothetical protein
LASSLFAAAGVDRILGAVGDRVYVGSGAADRVTGRNRKAAENNRANH